MKLFSGFIARDRAKQQKKRAERKARMPTTRLGMAHTEGSRLLPDRLALLDRMPKNARVAEIGVAFADFSREILARSDPAVLRLVDAWEMDRYRDGHFSYCLRRLASGARP